jgi:hypothetical protein
VQSVPHDQKHGLGTVDGRVSRRQGTAGWQAHSQRNVFEKQRAPLVQSGPRDRAMFQLFSK